MFDPLKRAARMIFKDEIRLRRDEGGLRIALEMAQGQPSSPTQVKRLAQEQRERDERQIMVLQLQAVLDETAANRYPPRQLLQVSQALHAEGLALLTNLPLAVLRTALDQLEDAVTNWSPTGLAALRSKMAVAVQERSLRGESEMPEAMSGQEMRAQFEAALRDESAEEASEQAALLVVYGSIKGRPPLQVNTALDTKH